MGPNLHHQLRIVSMSSSSFPVRPCLTVFFVHCSSRRCIPPGRACTRLPRHPRAARRLDAPNATPKPTPPHRRAHPHARVWVYWGEDKLRRSSAVWCRIETLAQACLQLPRRLGCLSPTCSAGCRQSLRLDLEFQFLRAAEKLEWAFLAVCKDSDGRLLSG